MSDFETVPRGTMAAQKELSEKWIFKIARLEEERDALAAHLKKIMPIAQYGLRAARCRNDPASLEWTNTLADTPATSLAHLKAQWQAEADRRSFIYGYHFCRANGFLFDDQLEGAADQYIRRQAEGGE